MLNFYKNPVEKLFNFLNKSFGGDENIFELIDYRLDVIELFKKEEYVPRIIYYVNTESKDDICNQYIPFLEKLFNLPFFKNDFHVCFYKEYKEEVHSPLPINESIKIIKQWINTNSLFNESFGNFEPKINVGFYSFLIPKGYKVHDINSITNGSVTLYLEIEKGKTIERINNYVNYVKNEGKIPKLSLSIINDFLVYKVETLESNTVRYWFVSEGILYHIFTYAADEFIDNTVEFLINSIKVRQDI